MSESLLPQHQYKEILTVTADDSLINSNLVIPENISLSKRRNIADKLVDTVRASILYSKEELHLEKISNLEKILLKSLELAPEFVNVYYYLAELYLHHSYSADKVYDYLACIWDKYGCNNESAFQFINWYKKGYPNELLQLKKFKLNQDCIVLYMSDNLEYLDILEYVTKPNQNNQLHFLGRIEHPHLICSPYDFQNLPATKQTIIEDLIKRGKDTRIVGHYGTWLQIEHRSVFGPAIDTLYYNSVIQKYLFNNPEILSNIKSVFEVGTGTGFLLCSVINAFKNRTLRVMASDIDPNAIQVAKTNIERTINYAQNESKIKHQVSFLLDEHSMEICADGSIDLLFSNPPYIPENQEGFENNPYSGTKVIEDILLNHGPRILSHNGIIILLYSSLTQKNMQYFLQKSPLIAVPLGKPRRVPLDLRECSNNPQWINFLSSYYDLEENLSHPRYVFWHNLHMLALTHKSNQLLLNQLEK